MTATKARGSIGSPWSGVRVLDVFVASTVVAIAIAALGLAFGEPIFVSLASVATIFALWPVLTRRASLFSPWGIVALDVSISVFIRGLFIAFRYPNEDVIQDLFVLGEADTFFFWPTLLLAATVGGGALAYMGGSRSRGKRDSQFLDRPWAPERVLPVAWMLAIASVLASLAFIQATDGLASLLSSIKRTTIPGLEPDSSYQSFGYLRSVAALGRVALLLLAAHYFLQPGRIPARRWVALGSLLLVAQVLPWYTSSRTGALFLLIEVLVVWFAAGRRLDMKRTIVVALSVLIIFQIMTSAREYGTSTTPRELLSPFVPGEAVVLTRNMLGIATTAHVVNAVGDELEPKNGGTIVSWLSAPVPRRIWPGKPLVQPGPEVGAKVFGTARSGVPAGLVGDLYWNFGVGGVLAGSIALFFLIGRWFTALAPMTTHNPSRIVVYVAVLFAPTWLLLGNGVGAALFKAMIDGVVVIGLVWLLQARRESRQSISHGS